MAKPPTTPGVYSPLSWRARRLVAQLRRATHRSVQHAIVQELLHELQMGSRKATQKLRDLMRMQARKVARKAGRSAWQKAKAGANRLRYGPKMQCDGCGRGFHNKLQFAAHARTHAREAQRQPQPRRGRQAATSRPQPTQQQRARQHAADVHAAAGRTRPVARVKKDGSGFTYDTPAGPMTSSKPLTAAQLKGLTQEVRHARDHARDLVTQGKAAPGDTVRTKTADGRRVSEKVVPARTAEPTFATRDDIRAGIPVVRAPRDSTSGGRTRAPRAPKTS